MVLSNEASRFVLLAHFFRPLCSFCVFLSFPFFFSFCLSYFLFFSFILSFFIFVSFSFFLLSLFVSLNYFPPPSPPSLLPSLHRKPTSPRRIIGCSCLSFTSTQKSPSNTFPRRRWRGRSSWTRSSLTFGFIFLISTRCIISAPKSASGRDFTSSKPSCAPA